MEQRVLLACILSILVAFVVPVIFFPSRPKVPPRVDLSSGKGGKRSDSGQSASSSRVDLSSGKSGRKPNSGKRSSAGSPGVGRSSEAGARRAVSLKRSGDGSSSAKDRKGVEAVALRKPFVITTSKWELHFDPQGACLRSVVLREFKMQDRKTPLRLLYASDPRLRSFLVYNLNYKDPKNPEAHLDDPLVRSYWRYRHIPAEGKGRGRVVFWYEYGDLFIEKSFEYERDSYLLLLKISFTNRSKSSYLLNYRLNGPGGILREKTFYYGLEGHIAREVDNGRLEVTSKSWKKIPPFGEEPFSQYENLHWLGITNKYFVALLYPDGVGPMQYFSLTRLEDHPKGGGKYDLLAFLAPQKVMLEGGKTLVHTYKVILAPKDAKILAGYGKEERFDRVIYYGWWIFAVFAKLFLGILHFFYNYVVANYGLAIIFLTILVKSCLFPITFKAQRSMLIMQKIQPKLKKIRDKYKGKKGPENMKKMNDEMMELYREYNISPLGGCLPILFQIPVFFGLYTGLNLDISLRQSPFVLWIQDLSMPDGLVMFEHPVRVLFFTFSGVHILPIIMVILMVVQQKMQPSTGDPQMDQQKKIFMYMMILMGFIFYNFPSGLVLYFIVQSVLGLLEQRWIRKRLEKEELLAGKV